MTHAPLNVPLFHAASTLVAVSDVFAKISNTGCLSGDLSLPLPSGTMTCGQAKSWLPFFMALITDRYPQLLDPAGLTAALNNTPATLN